MVVAAYQPNATAHRKARGGKPLVDAWWLRDLKRKERMRGKEPVFMSLFVATRSHTVIIYPVYTYCRWSYLQIHAIPMSVSNLAQPCVSFPHTTRRVADTSLAPYIPHIVLLLRFFEPMHNPSFINKGACAACPLLLQWHIRT